MQSRNLFEFRLGLFGPDVHEYIHVPPKNDNVKLLKVCIKDLGIVELCVPIHLPIANRN